MPTKLGTAFLGMMVGGSTFLITGFAVFLAISQLQYRGLEARVTQASGVQYAQVSPLRGILASAQESQPPGQVPR